MESRTCKASQLSVVNRSRRISVVALAILARDELGIGMRVSSFLVIIPRGSHPFPSRTRKLSLAGPMILHGQLCGNVGRRRDLHYEGRSEQSERPFCFLASDLQTCWGEVEHSPRKRFFLCTAANNV